MIKRIKLKDRVLPDYTKNEEILNTLTHFAGCLLGILVLISCLRKAILYGRAAHTIASAVYGSSMIALYAISSIYHSLIPGLPKRVMQVIDHCAIYFLIAGTYTPIMVCAFVPTYPMIGWGLLGLEWLLTVIAVTLTAIDLHKFKAFSMVCYIAMGWGIIFFAGHAFDLLSSAGFGYLLAGGIVYSIGAILFGIGSKVRWMHSVFHVFVVVGSFLQFIAIYRYVL